MRVLLLLVVIVASVSAALNPLSDKFIKLLQNEQSTWKAGRNFNKNLSMRDLQHLMGVLPDSKLHMSDVWIHTIPEDLEMPKEFDSRAVWKMCPTIGEIRDQGCCGSCWAFGAVEVMSDRECIHSKGKKNFHYSAENLVTCCHLCGIGCWGGFPGTAFKYWVNTGIVSGGSFNSTHGCQPYEMPSRPDCFIPSTPRCTKKCEANYALDYESDLHYGSKHYSIDKNETQIKYDIMINGPVAGMFIIYADFFHYKSGVYQHTLGFPAGIHAIRILGWGEENGTPYWLCANSWSTDWGDNGFFKILRGSNNCGIESEISTGLPKV